MRTNPDLLQWIPTLKTYTNEENPPGRRGHERVNDFAISFADVNVTLRE